MSTHKHEHDDHCHSKPASAKAASCCAPAVQGFDPTASVAAASFDPTVAVQARAADCCSPKPAVDDCCAPIAATSSCCDADTPTRRIDWLLWSTMIPIVALFLFHVAVPDSMAIPMLGMLSHAVYDLVSTMWWGMIAAIVFVGLLNRIPRELVMGVLGQGGTVSGLLRATGAGLLLDLCSHGILMVGMKLYERGASLGQIFAFLIASPWNSLSLTIILVALIGLPWTLLFIVLSMLIGVSVGYLVDRAVAAGRLPANPNHFTQSGPVDWRGQLRAIYRDQDWSPRGTAGMLWQGLKDSRMVLRWVFLGIILASLIRTFVTDDWMQMLFGPTLMGLGLTLLAATILEICSEGSTPIAAELFTRAAAPGNAFAFLMAGVATDYTEVMSIKDTTRSWKIALSLPLYTLPQVVFIGWLLNRFG